jgi:hypothetical protein
MTPGTVQIAPFEKYNHTYSGAIIDCISLNIKNETFRHTLYSPFYIAALVFAGASE